MLKGRNKFCLKERMKAYEWTTKVPDYPEIRMLAVDKDWRGKGKGVNVIEHLE